MKNIFCFICLIVFAFTAGLSQNVVFPLWPEEIPNYQKTDETETRNLGEILWIQKVQVPDIAVYLPSRQNANGQAVIICPGGGYWGLAYDWEGTDIASWLNSKGIAGIVLKYRLPSSKSVIIPHEVALQDAQRAVRMVRHHANEWNIMDDQIGIMGFSAGGHLTATLGTHFDHETSYKKDKIDLLSARPDFMALIYPLITLKSPYTRDELLDVFFGKTQDQELINYYSNELQVKPNTPPAFIVHSSDDEVVPVENSLMFYQALNNQGIPAEMHIYPFGGHGFSLALDKGYLQGWTDRYYEWLQSLK